MLVVLPLAGCASGPNHVKPGAIPDWAKPPGTPNMSATDLSQLGQVGVDSERIEPGDVLDISIVTNYTTLASTTTHVRVQDSGMADVPIVGPVRVAGALVEQAEQAIVAASIERGLFQKPCITVAMGRQRTNQITVTGGVKQPGTVQIPRGSSCLLLALLKAGGLSEEGGPNVEIRRTPKGPAPSGAPGAAGEQVFRVNLADAVQQASRVYPLADGDVVQVERRVPAPIHVLGLVKNPGEFKMPLNHDLPVLDALATAGGKTQYFADNIVITRKVPGHDEPLYIEVSIAEAERNPKANVPLAPGDNVVVVDTPVTATTRTVKDMAYAIIFGVSQFK